MYAQNKISGAVIDHHSGEALIGATVKHIGTGKEVFTDFDGNFTISGVKEGENQLSVSYVSYKEARLNRVVVKVGEDLTLKIKMRRASQAENTKPLLANSLVVNPES